MSIAREIRKNPDFSRFFGAVVVFAIIYKILVSFPACELSSIVSRVFSLPTQHLLG